MTNATMTKNTTIIRFVFNDQGTHAIPVSEKIQLSRQIRDIVTVKPSKFFFNGEELLLDGDNNNIIQIDVSHVSDPHRAAVLLTARYYMRGKGKNMKFYRVADNPKNWGVTTCYPVFGKDAVKFDERQNMTGFCRFGGPEGGQISTKNNVKKGVLTLLNNNNADRVRKAMDTADFGCLSDFIGQTVSAEKAVKLASRLGNWMAVTEDGPAVDNFAIYFGEFANGDLDGMSFTTLVKSGHAVQNRAYLCKTLSLGVSEQTMATIVSSLDNEPIVIDRSKITDSLNTEIREAIDRKGCGTRFEGRVLVIHGVEDECVQYLADMNALKASFDTRRVSNLNIVKRFDNRSYDASLANQVLTKILFQDTVVAKEIFKMAHQKALEDHFNFRAMDISEETLADDVLFSNAILSIDSDAKKKYGWIFKRSIDQVLKGDRQALNKFHMPMEGSYNVLIGDIGALFGIKLLNANEVFSNSLDAITEYTSIKFPSFDQREYATVRNIGDVIYDRIADAVNDGKLTAGQGAMLHDLCQELGKAVVMYPAMPIVKNRQAGLDFDGDCATFIRADLLGLKAEPIAVKCEPPTTKDSSQITIGWDLMAKAMAKVRSFGNLSVGAVTSLFVQFQYMELNRDFDTFKKFAVKFRNFGAGKKNYKPVLKIDGSEDNVKFVEVSANKISSIFAQIHDMKLDEENIIACLHDINMGVGRWYQESTIDASSKFYQVFVSEELRSLLNGQINPDVEVSINWKSNTVNSVKGQTFYMDNARKSIQYALTAQTQKMAQKAVDDVSTMPEFDQEAKDRCIAVYNGLSDDAKCVVKTLISEIKNAGQVYSATHDVTLYRSLLDSIENMYRLATFDYDNMSRIALLFGYGFIEDSYIIDKLGTKILRNEFVKFVRTLSESKVEVPELETKADPSIMVFRLKVKGGKDYFQNIKKHLEDEDAVVQLMTKGKAIVLNINGTPIFYKNEAGKKIPAFIDCGVKGSRLAKILVNREGKVASTHLLSDNKSNWATLLVTLYNVTKVVAKEEAAH